MNIEKIENKVDQAIVEIANDTNEHKPAEQVGNDSIVQEHVTSDKEEDIVERI
jgi:hypothetical protein